jgi:hypothetical protein
MSPLVLLAACASSTASPPKTPPPEARAGPPPAWLETKAGSRWLGFSSYCWNQSGEDVVTCADAVAPKCSQRSVPKLSVEKGETVRAHLAYKPSKAAVDDMRLKVDGRTVSWRIERAGPFVLFAKGPRKNDASYVGCGVLP